jgi:hypothetical protein
MAPRHPEIEALVRELALLIASGAPPGHPAITDAQDAIEAAEEAIGGRDAAADVAAGAERAIEGAREACERARELLSAGEEARAAERAAARSGELALESEIPETHPEKEAIETAVAGAFAGVRGRWKVAILVSERSSWWGLRVEGASVCWTGTLEGPDEQSPEFLAGRVREAVQLGLMQSALDRARGRATS